MKLRNLILAALLVAAGGTAMAQDQTVSVTVTTVSSMTLNTTTVTFASLAPGTPQQDASTTIDYITNDGATHQITVSTNGWAEFITGDYPTLTINSVSTTGGGTPLATSTLLIDAFGQSTSATTPVVLVSGIQNTQGTATVTFEAAATVTVPAQTYTATLTYTMN